MQRRTSVRSQRQFNPVRPADNPPDSLQVPGGGIGSVEIDIGKIIHPLVQKIQRKRQVTALPVVERSDPPAPSLRRATVT